MEGFCRGCLIKYDEPTDLVQYTEKNRRLYIYSTGLQVKRNDTFQFQLCKECYVNMRLSCKFKKQCRTSDKRYKNYLDLKEAGEVNDFCMFLKNNDDSLMFRFPLRSGNSTPAYQKPRDDDDESTCTSIRNFMTDIISANEIPDTEARIIREVIEEEADVMDDSLDSHWLQDDASIDTDFRLDFSLLSPFTTPQSTNNDRCYTPPKLRELVKQVKIIGPHENTETFKADQNKISVEVEDNSEINVIDPIINENEIVNLNSNENHVASQNIEDKYVTNQNIEENYVRQQNFYIEIEEFDQDHTENNVIQIEGNKDCTIENNLETALNESNKEYLLEDILKTPRIYRGASGLSTPTINNLLFADKIDENPMSGASTPTINKILFGDKLDDIGTSTPKASHEDMKGEIDILDDFFKDHNKSFDFYNVVTGKINQCSENENNVVNNEPKGEQKDEEPKYDLINTHCITCDKKFNSAKALKLHYAKQHHIFLKKAPRKEYRQYKICDTCGKRLSDYRSLIKHIKSHEMGVKKFTCKICKLKFTSKAKLYMHKKTHIDPVSRQKLEALRSHNYVCPLCGMGMATQTSLKIHLQRHENNHTYFCKECGRGFYRNHDLKVHMRTHNDDRPFGCVKCDKRFSRTDTLNRHMKIHNDERPYVCQICDNRFTRPSALTHHLKRSLRCMQARLNDEVIKRNKIDKGRRKQTYYCLVEDLQVDDSKLVTDKVNDDNRDKNLVIEPDKANEEL